ncbi:DNA topoisomerase I [Halodesulfurarchaeum formicicum]|uniref:DNA topoisomerase 1 n=1 Tax=Halodesulfurarchaeum formicicum TaxID=1873524 RepID=A0A1D8S5F8_9EURY|nr:DNA topoisomerase I [Halodesulfurarchaeum formicicum]AOW80590.1 DNA topoisomerase I [Halodesulfurarchaeum formicicum]
MELIITEKNNAARRIADILSDGSARTERVGGVDVYAWGTHRVIGLAGHVVGVDFPPEYEDWRDVEPAELVHAPIETRVTKPDIVTSLKRLARKADRVVIATDYDREGELIGKEAYELVREVEESVPVDRVRFSSITENEVKTAFANPDELDFELAAAGEARQRIDLLWGAALTRFLSLSAGQRGQDFISVGRVQTPTLKLVVDKEREIQAFDPETYWELFADLAGGETTFQAQYFYDDDGSEAERIWDETHATEAEADLKSAGTATVESVRRRQRTDDPPAPFDTTQFIKAAGSLGFNAGQAMSIAEDLYTAGYITYPRTDNTVYPDDLEPAELLAVFEGTPFDEAASSLLAGEDLEPTRGESETTDHPPIHPTPDVPDQGDLSEDEWTVYELVTRRFFATLAEPAVWEHLRVVAVAEGRTLKANGKRLVEPGYHAVYPYVDTSENYVPDLAEGQTLSIDAVDLEEKETQPPRRYGQSRLIETMEKLGIGTKSTRHNTIEKLYDRGYLEDDPPRPTQLAMAVVEAAEEYADLVVSEEMTQELEAEMTAIVEGEKELEDVTADSRDALDRIFDLLGASRAEIGEHLRSSLKADRTLGPCPECGRDLLIRENRYGSYFVGCDGYPDCEFTAPLPNRGEPQVMDETCDRHDLHHVKMLDGRNTFVHGCPLCQVEDAESTEDTVIGPCPECGEEHGGELAIKHLRNGSRLVGCTRYPDCEYAVPLPRRGEIEVTEERCADHDLPKLRIHDDDDDEPWEFGCPICNYQEYAARQNGDLESIDGIGEKTKAKLVEAGIESVPALLKADPDELAGEVDGVSADRIRDWQQSVG